MLSLENVSLFVNGKLLLKDANLKINRGDRKGIVGRNGSGKTHLLELLAGNISSDGGKRKLNDGVTVLLVKQELPDDDLSPLEYLRGNDPDIKTIEGSLENAHENQLGELYTKLNEFEERYEILAPKVLMGLGLKEKELTQPMRNLSGGLRMRIGLSMALVRSPDILLLDEPTNHLDLESTQWLIEFLKNYPKNSAFIIVTHDIQLLTAVTNATTHLRGGILTEYGGDYNVYRQELKLKEEKDKQKNENLDKEIKQKMEIYYRFRDLPEARAAQAKDMQRKAELLKKEKVEIIVEEPVISFTFPEPMIIPDPVIELKNVAIGYDKQPVLNNLNLSIQFGAKIGLLGRNGEGKTSLIKLLAGKLSPLEGRMDTGPRLKIGYFSQDLTDELNVSLTVFQQFQATTGITHNEQTRFQLSRFGFSWDKINTLVENLSGGEKTRLLFALICAREPNLIILDEPTNHLDVETREVLVNAIAEFKGSVILVSHDWDLHEKTMQKFWLAHKGNVQPYTKGLEHYQKMLLSFIEKNLQTNMTSRSGPIKMTSKDEVKTDPNNNNNNRYDGKTEVDDDDNYEVKTNNNRKMNNNKASTAKSAFFSPGGQQSKKHPVSKNNSQAKSAVDDDDNYEVKTNNNGKTNNNNKASTTKNVFFSPEGQQSKKHSVSKNNSQTRSNMEKRGNEMKK